MNNYDNNKLNLIFDMDQTLLHTIILDNLKYVNIDKNTECKIIKKKNSKFNIICIRKYFLFLIKYCFEHFNVGIWSTGGYGYVENTMKELLPDELYNKLIILIGKSKQNESTINFEDIANDYFFKLHKYNDRGVKNLKFLFEDKYYSKIFKPSNTLLIDDQPEHVAISPKNCIFIPRYCYSNNDNYLFHLYLWLRKHKNKKNIQNVEKLNLADYNKDFVNDCSFKEKFRLMTTKKLKLGDYVQFSNRKTKKKSEDGNKSIRNGYITDINNDIFEVIEYDEDNFVNLDLKIYKKKYTQLKKKIIN
tara:strand:- start:644 stop:1555 length:912 start_codon:yes stop_codon:yes gene_type:complete